jgi:hypothetical protein
LDVHDVERAFLRKLGAERNHQGHHVFFFYSHQGSNYTVAKLSHSWSGHLNDTQLGMLAKKLNLRKREFEEWVNCAMDNDTMIGRWQAGRAG